MIARIDHFNDISATHEVDGVLLTTFRGEPWIHEPLCPLAFRMVALASSSPWLVSQVDTDACVFAGG